MSGLSKEQVLSWLIMLRTSFELAKYAEKHPGLSPHVQMPELYCLIVQAEISSTASREADKDEDPQVLYDSGSGRD